MATLLLSEDKYKEPLYNLIDHQGNIEIRDYNNYIVARYSISQDNDTIENNMFRVLASYIFGNNEINQSISMTAPVTTFTDKNQHHMLFYMLDANVPDDLPKPLNKDIKIEKFSLNKCAVISFSWYVNKRKIRKYQNKLKLFLEKNNYSPISSFMVNRYDSPWTLPFLRRNEIIVKIR